MRSLCSSLLVSVVVAFAGAGCAAPTDDAELTRADSLESCTSCAVEGLNVAKVTQVQKYLDLQLQRVHADGASEWSWRHITYDMWILIGALSPQVDEPMAAVLNQHFAHQPSSGLASLEDAAQTLSPNEKRVAADLAGLLRHAIGTRGLIAGASDAQRAAHARTVALAETLEQAFALPSRTWPAQSLGSELAGLPQSQHSSRTAAEHRRTWEMLQ